MSISRLVRVCLICLGMLVPLSAQTSSAALPGTTNSTATVQVPRLIRFSGILTLPPAASGSATVNLTFSLYKEETGGTSLWQESQNVDVDSTGHYTVLLGATQAEGLPMEMFTSAQAQWLAVRLPDEAEQPRIMLVSVPFALKAGDAETFGGKPPSAYVAAPPVEANSTTSASRSAAPGVTTPSSASAASSGSQSSKNTPPVSGGTASYLPLWTSSSNLGTSRIFQHPGTGDIGIGTTNTSNPLEVHGAGALAAIFGGTDGSGVAGLYGANVATSGSPASGIEGVTESTSGIAIFGYATASSGATFGVEGRTVSPTGIGVEGVSSSTTGASEAVLGNAYSPDAIGVLGFNGATTGMATGVEGQSNSTSGIGVYGVSIATTGGTIGVEGESASPSGVGVFGGVSNTTGTGFGVEGTTATPDGSGVYGFVNSATANGVTGDNLATTGTSAGVYGSAVSSSGYAVYGQNTDTTGNGAGGVGVYGTTTSPNGTAVYGNAAATSGYSFGVYGFSASGAGVYGQSSGGPGVTGYTTQTNGDAVYAHNGAGGGDSNGIFADTASGGGVAGYFDNFAGGYILVGTVFDDGGHMFDVDGSGDGYFAGDLNVDGAINGGSKNFKIDHPLDPANKYLYHASVESSEMMNIYTGNVTTDGAGLATVQLPEWFEALNGDFRYQLTVMDQFAQAIVANKVANHHFTIRTDKPNVEVSWQITGVRHDAFANAHRLQVEVAKPPADRGHYLHPELFGAPKEARISHHSAPHKASAMHPVPAARAQQHLPSNAPLPRRTPLVLPKTPPSPPAVPSVASAH